MNNLYKSLSKYPLLILLVFVAIIFFSAKGQEIISYPPASLHMWRQSDCVAYARTYFEDNNKLLEPATYTLAGINGRVASEFPILYYVGAKLCHITGFHYWVFRGTTFLCYLLGLVFLFKIARLWIRSSLLALFPVLILATSPFYYYYALNFLPNVPSIAFSFAGLYYLLSYKREGKVLRIVLSTVFFLLSTALKPTDGGIAWLAALCAFALDALVQRRLTMSRKVLTGVVLSTAVILLGICSWYLYVQWYNDQYHNHQNLQGLYPIWDMKWEEIRFIIRDRVFDFWQPGFHNIAILYFTIGLLIIFALKWKALDHFLRYLTLFCALGTFAYSLMWFHAFADHDYYQLVFVVAPVFLSITVLEYYERRFMNNSRQVLRYMVSLLLLSLVTVGVVHNARGQEWRYTDPGINSYNRHMYELEPYLEKWGIGKQDVVLCKPDASPNISLVAVGRKGFTDHFFEGYDINFFKSKGAKYLIIVDSSYYRKPIYKEYTNKLIGTYQGINVYDIR